MPLIKIHILKGKDKGYKKAILNAVHKALTDVFLIPDHDRLQQIYEFEKEDFEINPYMSDNATIIEIIAFSGRKTETKKELYRQIVNNLGHSPSINSMDVMIIINEQPKENWGIRGGQQASEIEIGFKTDI